MSRKYSKGYGGRGKLRCSPAVHHKIDMERRFKFNVKDRFAEATNESSEVDANCVHAFIKNIPYEAKGSDLVRFLLDTLALTFGLVVHEVAILHYHLFIENQLGKSKSMGRATVVFSQALYFNHLKSLCDAKSLVLRGRHLNVNESNKKTPFERNKLVYEQVFPVSTFQVGSGSCGEDSLAVQWESFGGNVIFAGKGTKYFAIEWNKGAMQHKIEFAYRHMHSFSVERDAQSDAMTLRFRLRRPPMIWAKGREEDESNEWVEEETASGGHINVFKSTLDKLLSQLSLSGSGLFREEEFRRCVDPSGESAVFGRCLDYRVVLASPLDETALLNCLKKLTLIEHIPLPSEQERLSSTVVAANLSVREAIAEWQAVQALLSFHVKFHLHLLVSNNKLDPVAFILAGDHAQMVEMCALLLSADSAIAAEALNSVFLDQTLPFLQEPLKAVQCALDWLAPPSTRHETSQYYAEVEEVSEEGSEEDVVHRVFITPLRICAQPDAPDQSNRILRKHKEIKHRFLRVTLLDESFGNLSQVGCDEVFAKRLHPLVRDGFELADRHFVFLGYSNSQLREHSCWFYDESPVPHDEDKEGAVVPSAEQVRAWVGNLTSITTVGKFAARLGQGFSASTNSLDVLASEMLDLPEVTGNGFDFSDGVGMIHPEFAKLVAKSLRLAYCPSAFQIRYGGCKGMVSVAPPDHPALQRTGWKLAMRPSMRKFESSHTMLEIVGYAKWMPLYLNRQIIPILTAMGVKDNTVTALLEQMLRVFESATEDNSRALDTLEQHGNVSRQTTSEGGLQSTVSNVTAGWAMLQNGFDVQTEPHLRGIVAAVRSRALLDVQMKSRIFVPGGVCLYGVMDETDTLEEGQVFVQFSSRIQGGGGMLQQSVVVGRSPSLHAGDIRVLQAVHVPALSHLLDVVVFPAKGRRPHPNEMSGGDLDGDIYFVFYDQFLVKECTILHDPMDFTPPEPTQPPIATSPGNIAQQIGKFFVDYIKNDNLGQIASAHVAHADKSEYGVTVAQCVELAELHSVAVDFAKTGVPATFPSNLRVKDFPDFMNKPPHKTYESCRLLGRMYRRTGTLRYLESKEVAAAQKQQEVDSDLVLSGAEKYLEGASELLNEYNAALWQLMCQYQVFDECELLSGFVCQFAARVSREKASFDVQGRLNRAVTKLRAHFHQQVTLRAV